jgi:predicted SnoaL-like aldol condensation-catalyzing enzyme
LEIALMKNVLRWPLWRVCAGLFLAWTATTSAMAQSDAQSANKQLVVAAFEKVFIAGQLDATEQYFHEGYIQHNPDVPTGRAGLVGYLKAFRGQFPSQKIKLNHVVAEGDKVTIFSEWEVANPGAEGKKPLRQRFLIADVFRVEGGKLAEHWDVIQVLR